MAEPARQILRPLQAWRTRALVIGACLSCIAAAAGALPFSWSWQEAVDLHLLFRARGPRPAPAEVVLVPIDGRTAKRLFMPAAPEDFERCGDVRSEPLAGYRNPDPPDILTRWPRCLHARALEALALAQPDVVVMDISFRPRSDPGGVFADQDRRLAAAMRNVGKVVLVRKIRGDEEGGGAAQPIQGEIEAAALASAPFLLLGDQLQRADKFCTFMEAGAWSGPCLPAVVHQVASLELYPELHELLGVVGTRNTDLIPAAATGLLPQGALQIPVRLIRHLAMSDRHTAERLRAALSIQLPGATPSLGLRRLTEIYVGSGTRYFNFYGPPGAFQTLRYESLAVGADAKLLQPASLRGKIVFIGFAEQGTPEPIEHFTTPFTTAESVKLSGVELAATAYANLHDGSAIEAASWWVRALIVLSIGLSCTLLCAAFRPLVAVLLCLGCLLAYFGGALIVFDRYAAWLPLLVPLAVAAPMTIGAGLAARFIEVKRVRDYLGNVIRDLLPRPQARRIIEENVQLRELQQSVPGLSINTDIARYTQYAEEHTAEEVVRLIGPYFTELRRIAEDHGVYAIDFAGDSMMASWADRTADAALRARLCTAALKLAAATENFRLADPGPALATRIGMAYGPVKFALVGDAIAAVGEPPNTAQRLQAFNQKLGTRVIVSQSVIEGVKGFLVRDLGHFLLRGKTQPTHVYQLIDFQASATPAQLTLCRKFEAALAAYRAQRREEARMLFEELAATDGPSAFYAGLCAKGYFQQHSIAVE
jgi:adenylate cyclase